MVRAMRATSRSGFRLTSRRVARRHEALGRIFGGLALLAIAGPFLVSVIASVLAGVLHDPSLGRFAVSVLFLTLPGVLAALGLSFLSLLFATTAVGWKGPAHVAADAAGLRFTSGAVKRSIPRTDIRSGLVLSDPHVRVELCLRRGQVIEVHVAREEEGARLLAALGIGPTERRVAVSLGSVHRELAAGCVGVPVFTILWLIVISALTRPLSNAGSFWPVVAWAALALLSTWLLRRAARSTQVVVGTDGVRVERPFSTVWIPYAELAAVRTLGERLLLSRRGGGSVVLRTKDTLTEALAQRIRDAHEGATAGGAAPRGAEALERRGRELGAWREDLRKLLAAGDYRAAGLTPEDALHALDDASAPRDRRVGAALFLRVAGYPEAQEHIRVAAGATADDALRAALEHAAEEEVDDAALARVLR
ncbi:hypothetical protein [Sorangium atrum]|uniref:PH domain-containing protein n=1 Tax=Sorangium atrum TaxID=2995308 RepID=A0ABT5BXD7_9BACT|nr:hypothetical protein [Sorangium aterium]MDC0678747.1 hypothetical protein [Sorangium aterium]